MLASTGSAALMETTKDKALYTVGDKYYTYNTEKLKDSGYSLKEATSADEPNTITLYDKETVIKYYDPQTGKEVAAAERLPDVEYKEVPTIQTTPKYYTVSLKQTEYGDKTVPDTKAMYFKWVDDVNGNRQLIQDGATVDNNDIVYYAKTEYGNPTGNTTLAYGWEKNADNGNLEFKQNPTTPVGEKITYKYSETDFSKTETHTLDKGTIVNPSGSFNYPKTIEGGAALNNPSGSTTSIDNVLFKDNITKAGITSTISAYQYADVLGGAVYNAGDIMSITGAFVNNGLDVTQSKTQGYLFTSAYGGAIANKGTIGNINADFIGNYVLLSSSTYSAYGGAIFNYYNSTIGDITGDFIGNYASAANSSAKGGAIYNGGTIGNITGDFVGNYASQGGAIYSYRGTIGDITGNFIGNYASDSGGAIYNNTYNGAATIGDITGDFIGNYSSASGGAIYNSANRGAATIGDITGDFINNYVSATGDAAGGAIYNTGTIGNITGDFIGNYASSTSSYNVYGGAIYNSGTIGDITGDFIANYSSARGGAISN